MIRTLKKISNIVCAYGNISNFLKVYFNYVSNFPQLNASNKVGAQSRHTFQLRDPSAHNQSIRAKLSFPRIFKTTFNLELKQCREKKKGKKKRRKKEKTKPTSPRYFEINYSKSISSTIKSTLTRNELLDELLRDWRSYASVVSIHRD